MCDSFDHAISNGEKWTANALWLTNLNASNVAGVQYPNAGVTGYLEAAYLFNEAVTAFNKGNGQVASQINWAVWDLMMGSKISGAHLSLADEQAVEGYLNGATALGPGLTPGQFAGDVIYTPTDLSANGPQEFFGFNPPTLSEPSTLTVLGSGLFAFGILIRRKLQ